MRTHSILTVFLMVTVSASALIAPIAQAGPQGTGSEQIVPLPDVQAPLPALEYGGNNEGNGRYYRDTNPVTYVLRGINDIWQGTTEKWQTTAGDYRRDEVGYRAGDGPNPEGAPNGQPSDYVAPGTEIKDAATWEANIAYVVKRTAERTDDEAIFAFLDDLRSKNYSVIDGFGPLTEDVAKNTGAYAEFQTILVTDVLENTNYKPPHNDSFSTYGGDVVYAPLNHVANLASIFRNNHASTSGPKYLYGTPRPWRMNDAGEVVFQGAETKTCVDGFSADRATKEVRLDVYETSVQLIPGLTCGRRSHSSSHEKRGLYTPETENRRKDNGYPSGHANAGILAALAFAYAMPERFTQLVARGVDLGENRVVSGMHSPVDVIGGRVQATMISAAALNEFPLAADLAYRQTRAHFGPQAEAAGMSLLDYANRPAETEHGLRKMQDGVEVVNVDVFNNNRFDDLKQVEEDYSFRLTYGLPQTGEKGLPAIVPEGAEALLKSRLPYLSDMQRRAVLATTSLDSGYPLLDKTNGWGRLNLVAAGNGYGAFEGDVAVTMEASKGHFNAASVWSNDISGPGMLTLAGDGTLTLAGNNSFAGGVLIEGGTLRAASNTAFGEGDVLIKAGAIAVGDAGLTLKGALGIEGGVLVVDVSNAAAGSEIVAVEADTMSGAFEQIVLEGAEGTARVEGNKVIVYVAG